MDHISNNKPNPTGQDLESHKKELDMWQDKHRELDLAYARRGQEIQVRMKSSCKLQKE
jgi:hypothetical protein